MYSQRYHFVALSLLALCALAALLVAGVVSAGVNLTPWMAGTALAVCAVLLGGIVFLHNVLRVARWDAGHRLR
ncbi:MAG TPA: hypothetical protein VMZ74_00795 [Ramlibacter sp.]|nr:hypothetical protein [Ramlibacter sp.]